MGKHPIPGTGLAASVGPVSTPLPDLRRYLVEWYCPDTTEQALADRVATITANADRTATGGATVALLTTWLLPSDELVVGLFAASSGESVADLCRRSGYPAGRLSVAVEVPQENRRHR